MGVFESEGEDEDENVSPFTNLAFFMLCTCSSTFTPLSSLIISLFFPGETSRPAVGTVLLQRVLIEVLERLAQILNRVILPTQSKRRLRFHFTTAAAQPPY